MKNNIVNTLVLCLLILGTLTACNDTSSRSSSDAIQSTDLIKESTVQKSTSEIINEDSISVETATYEEDLHEILDLESEAAERIASGQSTVGYQIPSLFDKGELWLSLSYDEKVELVNQGILDMEKEGYQIIEESDWFIERLDGLYGHPVTNETTVSEALMMAGLAGGGVLRDN